MSINEPQLFPHLGPKQISLPPNAEVTMNILISNDLTRE